MADKKAPVRGLSSIREQRQLRESRVLPAASGKFWLWSLVSIGVMIVFYFKKTADQNDATRTRILARERELKAEMGPAWFALRDKVEAWTMKTAADTGWNEDTFVDPDFHAQAVKGEPELLKQPGIYLRLARQDGTSVAKIRAASRDSLRDAFTACFLRTPHLDEHVGKACKRSRDCEKGQMCNELDVCATPSSPYNMRTLYKGMRVLSDTWVNDVETSTEELRLRLFEMDVEDAFANDVPVAREMIAKARYFLVVLDEVPYGMEPEDGGTVEQAVQSTAHETRVALYDLASGKAMVRMKRTIDVETPIVPGAIESQRRQILNCALAQEIRGAITRE